MKYIKLKKLGILENEPNLLVFFEDSYKAKFVTSGAVADKLIKLFAEEVQGEFQYPPVHEIISAPVYDTILGDSTALFLPERLMLVASYLATTAPDMKPVVELLETAYNRSAIHVTEYDEFFTFNKLVISKKAMEYIRELIHYVDSNIRVYVIPVDWYYEVNGDHDIIEYNGSTIHAENAVNVNMSHLKVQTTISKFDSESVEITVKLNNGKIDRQDWYEGVSHEQLVVPPITSVVAIGDNEVTRYQSLLDLAWQDDSLLCDLAQYIIISAEHKDQDEICSALNKIINLVRHMTAS